MDQVRSRPDLCGAFCMNGDKERAQPSRPRKKSPPVWVVIFGAGDEARTRYLDLGKVALYQMSYARKMVPQAGVEPATRGFSVRCSTN